MKKAILLAAAVLMIANALSIASIQTEKEPTLEETLSWIQAKLKETPNPVIHAKGRDGWYDDFEYYKLAWEGGKVDFVKELQGNITGETWRISKYVFMLKDLDSYSVKLKKGGKYIEGGYQLAEISLQTYLNKEAITYHIDIKKDKYEDPGIRDGKCYELRFYATDELAERLVKAWQHAIKLCGGNTKKEIF